MAALVVVKPFRIRPKRPLKNPKVSLTTKLGYQFRFRVANQEKILLTVVVISGINFGSVLLTNWIITSFDTEIKA